MRFLFCIVLCLASPVWAEVTGPVRVIDGDTIDVGDTRVRLFGIDAPEMGQPCQGQAGEFDCGDWVTGQVAQAFDGLTASCEGVDFDRYGRLVATCRVGRTDLAQWIVAEGFARAYLLYSDAYELDEKAAAIAGRGIWSYEQINPAAFRNRPGRSAPDPRCVIKGNISSGGRIYHLPHHENYGRTRINQAKGERWFCTEGQAQQAGWRAARR
jgi:endonuclease YncB( thermonuclease family)